jgi:hypothetical protein
VIERPTRSCPYPRPDGWETDTTPFSSADMSFSPDALESTDAIDETELRERIAKVSAVEEAGNAGSADAAEQPGGMSASLKGMLLLNLGAALFGSNMVSRPTHANASASHLQTVAPQAFSIFLPSVGGHLTKLLPKHGRVAGRMPGSQLGHSFHALWRAAQVAIKAAEDSMSSTALSATRFSIAALAFAPYVWRGLKLPHVRRSAAELALWLLGGLLLALLRTQPWTPLPSHAMVLHH